MNKKTFLIAAIFVAASLSQSNVWGGQRRPRRRPIDWSWKETTEKFKSLEKEQNPIRKIDLIKDFIKHANDNFMEGKGWVRRYGMRPRMGQVVTPLHYPNLIEFMIGNSCLSIAMEVAREIARESNNVIKRDIQKTDYHRYRDTVEKTESQIRLLQQQGPPNRWKLNEWRGELKGLKELKGLRENIREKILKKAMRNLTGSFSYRKAIRNFTTIQEIYYIARNSKKMDLASSALKGKYEEVLDLVRRAFDPKRHKRKPKIIQLFYIRVREHINERIDRAATMFF
jgi:hypothetical protein